MFRFDDASVSPTSLQNALHTSAYVIFYEMLKSTRNQICATTNNKVSGNVKEIKAKMNPVINSSPSTPAQERRSIIGPQLPSPAATAPSRLSSSAASSSNSSASTSAVIKSSSSVVRPKMISEPPKKPSVTAPVKVGGLVPYDGDSDTDDDEAPPVVKQSPVIKSSASTTSSPFLPRAVNLKKLKDTINKEESPHIVSNGVSASKKSEPGHCTDLFTKVESSKPSSPSPSITQSNRNEFHVREVDSDKTHSDNSSGSTTSFTVTDISSAKPSSSTSSDSFLATSRQRWTVLPQTESHKRERVSPVESSETVDDQDQENQGSPKKRKKTHLFENGGTILEKAAEIGKEILNAGAKLFKSKNEMKDAEETSTAVDSGTSCEASTSYSHEKPSSSKVSLNDEEHSKKHKKKKKKKHKEDKESSDSDLWVEKTRDNLDKFKDTVKQSECNPDAPVKNWESKPDHKSVGGSGTWDGSKSDNIGELLRKQSEIRSWSGDRSQVLERKTTEPRKRSAAQELDAELDAGRVKKVKKWREEEERWTDKNPFQLAQNHRNKGESLEDKPEFQRRYEEPCFYYYNINFLIQAQ